MKQCGRKRIELEVLDANAKLSIYNYQTTKFQDIMKGRKLMKELYKREANLAMIIKKFDVKMVPLVLAMDEVRPKLDELMALYTDLREKTQAQIPLHNELQERKSFIKYIPVIYHFMKERAARVIQRNFREYLDKQAARKRGGRSKKKGKKGRSRSKTKKPAAGTPRKASKSKSKSKSPAKPKSKSLKPKSKSPKPKSKSPKPKVKSPGAKAKKPKKAKVKTPGEGEAEGATPKSKKRAGSKGKRNKTPKKKVPEEKSQLEGNEHQQRFMINASAEERIEIYRISTLAPTEGMQVEEKPLLVQPDITIPPKERPIFYKPPPSDKQRSSHRVSKNPRTSKPKTKTDVRFKILKSAGSKDSLKLAVEKTASKISARRLTGYNRDVPVDDDVSDWSLEDRKSALKKQNAIARKSKQKSIPRDSLLMKSRTSSRKSSTRKSLRKSAAKPKISEEKPMVIWSRADFAD